MAGIWHEARNRRRSGGTNPWTHAASVGFWAGLIWGLIHWLCELLRFTSVHVGYWIEPFFLRKFLVSPAGHAAGIASFIVFSVAAALLYRALLIRFRGPWAGIVYGTAWWAAIFGGLGPLFGMTAPLTRIGWNTIWTEWSIHMLWGLFIGYSIAFEFHDSAGGERADHDGRRGAGDGEPAAAG
ncbi:YqhR family membrane protein [Thermobacillus sp. ZCTH02-B1]|uniref:YqhR family membrane protein n=1 Tax=Thermobacillus sp. ZCTH02-B1 TaxID=1858795 RepID=UPI0025FF5D45|nr:YqhR family membrane protein [Thermobacillus sp. ZCTH02-B1]